MVLKSTVKLEEKQGTAGNVMPFFQIHFIEYLQIPIKLFLRSPKDAPINANRSIPVR